ncbi:MAG: hypothetical protein IE881_06530 [Epsilonproteobacteria bacterium]|nr:hypothetical protein [Campylobacterota bacterium]
MIKKILILSIVSSTFMVAKTPKEIYEKNCVECHATLPSSLEKMFMSYIKTYSGERATKIAIKTFLKKPDLDTSVMSEIFLDKFGVKKPTKLNDKELDSAIEYYFNQYKIKGRLN